MTSVVVALPGMSCQTVMDEDVWGGGYLGILLIHDREAMRNVVSALGDKQARAQATLPMRGVRMMIKSSLANAPLC
jgi:hypothetical protein